MPTQEQEIARLERELAKLQNGKGKNKPPSRSKTWEESPDYGSLFQRDSEPPRPNFTGEGMLSAETLDTIRDTGGAFQISLWTLDREGQPLRMKDGRRRFRIHVEPPWQPEDSGGDDDFAKPDEDDDLPF